MSKQSNKKPAPAKSSEPSKARMIAYAVRNYTHNGEEKSDWTNIGVAFLHQDGKGLNVTLHALPVDGKIVLRDYEPKDESGE